MTDKTEDERVLRDRVLRMQALYIALLYCPVTREAWRRNAAGLLAARGLGPEAAAEMPDIDSPQFRAEVHGRRVMIERDIAGNLAGTCEWLAGQAGPAGAAAAFDAFLGSEYFLLPWHSVPHATGVGAGYESVSKFYFWLRDTYGLARPGADIELRNRANREFATFLLLIYGRPHPEWYDRLRGGVWWRLNPAEELPVILMTDALKMFSLGNQETVAGMKGAGLVDLDTLVPPDWPAEPTV